jgi:hypothetical protein
MTTTTKPETPRRKKRRIRLFWIVVLSPLVLILLLLLGNFCYQANLQRQIDAELAQIRQRGEPVTAADIAANYELPAGADDQTQRWMQVIDWTTALEKTEPYKGLTDQVLMGIDIPPPGTPWPEEPAVAQLMHSVKHTFMIDRLVADPGEVRYPIDFDDGIGALLPYTQNLRSVARVLALRAAWNVYHDRSKQALECLIAIRRAADTVEHEPTMVSQLVRAALDGIMVETTLSLVPHANWSDAQLERLQTELLTGGITEQDMLHALAGQRVISHMAFDSFQQEGVEVPATFAWTRRADELYFLQSMHRIHESYQQPWPEAETVGKQITAEMDSASTMEQWQHALTYRMLPATTGFYRACQQANARDRAAAVLIACQRYHLRSGQWPQSQADLVPEFLDAVPLDPFGGKPLGYQVQGDQIIVYSIGENLIDDGGVSDDGTHFGGPDYVFTLNFSEDATTLPKAK